MRRFGKNKRSEPAGIRSRTLLLLMVDSQHRARVGSKNLTADPECQGKSPHPSLTPLARKKLCIASGLKRWAGFVIATHLPGSPAGTPECNYLYYHLTTGAEDYRFYFVTCVLRRDPSPDDFPPRRKTLYRRWFKKDGRDCPDLPHPSCRAH